jgi:hypothetical protein
MAGSHLPETATLSSRYRSGKKPGIASEIHKHFDEREGGVLGKIDNSFSSRCRMPAPARTLSAGAFEMAVGADAPERFQL